MPVLVGLLVLLAFLLACYVVRADEKQERQRRINERRYVRLSWDDKDREDGWWRGL